MASLLSLRLKAWMRSFAPGVMSCIADSGFTQLLGEQPLQPWDRTTEDQQQWWQAEQSVQENVG